MLRTKQSPSGDCYLNRARQHWHTRRYGTGSGSDRAPVEALSPPAPGRYRSRYRTKVFPRRYNSDDKSRKDFRTTLIRRGAHIANVVVAVHHGYLGAEPTQTPRQSAYAHEKLGFRADRNPRRVSTRSQNHSEMGESVDQASGPCSRGNPPRTVDWQKPSPL